MNADFGLTFAKYGDAQGVNNTLSDVSFTGFVGAEPSLTSTGEVILNGFAVTPGTAAGPVSTFTVPSDVTVQFGDILRVRPDTAAGILGGEYLVSSQLGDVISLAQEIHGKFDGTTLDSPTAHEVTIDILRDNLVVTSPSSTYGVTRVEYLSTDSFAWNAVSDDGVHNTVTLTDTLNLGSPVRVGDVVCENTGAEARIGTVAGIEGGSIVLSLDDKTLTTTDFQIFALGADSYKKVASLAAELVLKSRELPDFGRFRSKLGVFMGTKTSRHLVNEDLVKYLTTLAEIKALLI